MILHASDITLYVRGKEVKSSPSLNDNSDGFRQLVTDLDFKIKVNHTITSFMRNANKRFGNVVLNKPYKWYWWNERIAMTKNKAPRGFRKKVKK